MANRKISDLTALTAPATGDLLPIVDISEAAAADKNKKITFGELLSSAPAGSAAAPSFSFDADPNTGIFNPAADTLAFAEGGSEVMRIDSSGRLLVGTSSSSSNATAVLQANPGANIGGGVLLLQRGQTAADIGSNAADLGYIWFADNAGNRFAEIIAQSDGTAGTNDYPGRLAFYTTADGASTSTERMRIDSAGRVLVGTSTANTSGAKLQTSDGLTFPVNAVASADPNTLDDYEEGTWTPVLADADTGGNIFTHAVQNGLYTKVGNVVTVYFRVTWTSKGSASGVIRLRGFPFTSKSTLNSYWYAGITVNTNGQNVIRLAGNSTVATFADTAGADGVATEFSASDTTAGINGSMTYLAT